MSNKELKTSLQKSGLFSYLDIHFAKFIQRLDGRDLPEIYLAAALVSNYNRQGHICLNLKSVAGKSLFEKEDGSLIICPQLNNWMGILNDSPVIGSPGQFKPLILADQSRLYLYRYWEYQQELANLIKSRVTNKEIKINPGPVQQCLERYFSNTGDTGIDWHKVAAFTALSKNFCVISGGPGTGKTTTIAKIMAFLLEQNEQQPLRIALAAPTGKAAARLQEAIKITKDNLNCPENIKKLIPEKTATIHRLLGTIPNSPYFRYNAQNPLLVDVMIVDEASMVDLALMSKLVQALPIEAKLILVGDKDQLASVEAGAVLGDICDTGNPHNYSEQFYQKLKAITGIQVNNQQFEPSETGIQDCIIQLTKSYRFSSESGISAVSHAVNNGDGTRAIQILKNQSYPGAKWIPLPDLTALPGILKNKVSQGFKNYLLASDPQEVFQLFDQFRLLCALRGGPYGVNQINIMVEQILREARLIKPQKLWYHGRPVMITTNNYNLNLFNGDVGIALADSQSNNDIRVFFTGVDNTIRKFHPLRLPPHETVFAMTVHKSQGSEFDNVLLLLPDTDSPLLTRELIYTGITRARNNVEVWGVEQIFKNAVARRIERTSGLRDTLWD